MNAPMTAPTEADLRHLRRCFALAGQAREAGQHPFAALVADENEEVLVEAQNQSRPPDGDPTQHAELLAASRAARIFPSVRLARSTLYASAEPCCMCAGAIYWANIGRVVYGLSEHRLLLLPDLTRKTRHSLCPAGRCSPAASGEWKLSARSWKRKPRNRRKGFGFERPEV